MLARLTRALAALAVVAGCLAPAADALIVQENKGMVFALKAQNLSGGSSPSQTNISYECAVESQRGGNVELQECYLLGADGVQYGTLQVRPGPVSGVFVPVRAGTAMDVPAQAYSICARAQTFNFDLTWAQSDLVCDHN